MVEDVRRGDDEGRSARIGRRLTWWAAFGSGALVAFTVTRRYYRTRIVASRSGRRVVRALRSKH